MKRNPAADRSPARCAQRHRDGFVIDADLERLLHRERVVDSVVVSLECIENSIDCGFVAWPFSGTTICSTVARDPRSRQFSNGCALLWSRIAEPFCREKQSILRALHVAVYDASMLPRVFVSSSIEDLHHLRDAIRDVISELSFQPVMSEYGDVGYLPNRSAAESCYNAVRQCQIAILILGKRYGSVVEDGRSITHTEFVAARDSRLPVICLVDREVLIYKRMFDANRQRDTLIVPGMENPEKIFAFMDEIGSSPVNNTVLPFTSTHEARSLVKGQISHIVGELFSRPQDPIVADIRELMADLKTLRHEFAIGKQAPHFMRAARFLLNEHNAAYREIVEALFGTIENGIPELLDCSLFDEVAAKVTGRAPELLPVASWNEADQWIAAHESELGYWAIYDPSEQPDLPTASVFAILTSGERAYGNQLMLQDCQKWHDELRRFARSADASVIETSTIETSA